MSNLHSPFHIIPVRSARIARDARARRLWRLHLQALLKAKRYKGDIYLPTVFARLVPMSITRHAARLQRLAFARYHAFIEFCDNNAG